MRHRWSPPGGRSAQCGPIVSDAQRRGGRRGPATTPDVKVDGPLGGYNGDRSPGRASASVRAACTPVTLTVNGVDQTVDLDSSVPLLDVLFEEWFTLQSGMVGRLVPETGVMTIGATPSSGTYPYGIAVNSHGVPW